MPYKIVKTIEKGKSVLTTVPSNWEKDGILFWPQKNQNKLRKIEQSEPEENWLSLNCILKRSNLKTFQRAEYEMGKMCNKSETETDNEENYRKANQDHLLTFDDVVQECIMDQNEFRVLEEPNQELPETMDRENLIIIAQENLEPQQSFVMQESATSDMQVNRSNLVDDLLAKMDVIIQSNERVHESIKILEGNQKVLFENQQSLMLNLSQISVQFEQLIKQFSCSTDKKQNIDVQVITNLKDLQNFENLLQNPDTATEVKKKFSVICGKGKGRGVNNAYSLIDAIFDRSFLQKCSWAGGSRSTESKICFKSHTKLIDLFFEIIYESDNTFTLNDCHNFFKNILKNSRQRNESKKLRTSTTKNRPKLKKNHNKENDAPIPVNQTSHSQIAQTPSREHQTQPMETYV